jgi:hypothetical protein
VIDDITMLVSPCGSFLFRRTHENKKKYKKIPSLRGYRSWQIVNSKFMYLYIHLSRVGTVSHYTKYYQECIKRTQELFPGFGIYTTVLNIMNLLAGMQNWDQPTP